jgi:acyl dehydratase
VKSSQEDAMPEQRVQVGGCYFEDFEIGQRFDTAPALTLTAGHAALYQATVGDRLRLALDAELSRTVTGRDALCAHPNLVCAVIVGQSTLASQRVRANLFYRGLILLRPVFIGETLSTVTEVVALKQNQHRPGRPPTGLVALRMRAVNQHGEPVLDCWRCAMVPLRDPEADTGRRDSFTGIPGELDLDRVLAALPGWRLDRFRELAGGEHLDSLRPGTTYVIEGRDTVTSAPELARATLNIAAVHTDAGASPYGRRLVFGGHTIGLAAAQALRALPNLVTIVAWRSCDHTGPVFEGDLLRTELSVGDIHRLPGGHGVVELAASVYRSRPGPGGAGSPAEDPVLDWRFLALMA